MTTIIEYRCDICHRKYNNIEHAQECEAQGLFPLSDTPVGLMKKIDWTRNGGQGYGIFAVSSDVKLYSGNPHLAHESFWAYRSWEYFSEDIIELEKYFGTCGGTFMPRPEDFKKMHWIKPEDLELREAKWLIRQLKGNNITPSYYNKEGQLIKL